MYLHLGQSVVVPHRDILGIFDLDNASWAFKTREFLERAEAEGRAVWVCDDLPGPLCWWAARAKSRPYISPSCPPPPSSAGPSAIPLSRIQKTQES